MWILECDSDVLKNKRVWLRPGKTYLFGRTKPETGRYQTGFQINHKTVSRKHLILKVEEVTSDSVALIGTRSEIIFEDAGTKLGTTINGNKKITGGQTVTTNEGRGGASETTHVLRLGGYDYDFRITWKPVVFSYTLSSKELKNSKDPLGPVRTRLAAFDVKATSNYVTGKTTHIIASKRNTARGLQALIQGARIVTDEFVGALEVAATASDLVEAESFAPLEVDFDAGWPDETNYLPAPGKEPGPKGAEHYAPAEQRAQMFNDFTFIFFDVRQYENLQAPITDGGGKAVLHQMEPNVTSVREAHRFVKDTAGETDSGELSGDNKVVCVKFGSPKGAEDWSAQFTSDLCLAVGFRMIEQNEFLDAILAKDPQKLFRRLQYADEPASTRLATPLEQISGQNSAAVSASPEPLRLPARRGMRGKVQSVFKGFDDGFDEQVIAPAPAKQTSAVQATGINGQIKSEVNGNLATGTRANGRKRPVPGSDDDAELREIEANMFQGAAMMKKRRLETRAFDTDNVSSGQSTRATSELVATNERPVKRVKKERDIKDAVRAHREAEEAKQQQGSNEENDPGIDDMTLDQMRTLAVIEDFEPSRKGKQKAPSDSHGPRWKDEWNGRKNFKKFRRQGEGADRRRGQTVIIQLEEVKQKDAGIGEVYWSTNKPQSKVSRSRQRADSSDEEELSISRRSGSIRTQQSKLSRRGSTIGDFDGGDINLADVADSNSEEAEGVIPNTVPSNLQAGEDVEVIDVGAPRTTRAHGRATQATSTQKSSTLTGTKRRERAATQSSTGASAPKRQKRIDQDLRKTRLVAESDSDEDLAFKFKKRK